MPRVSRRGKVALLLVYVAASVLIGPRVEAAYHLERSQPDWKPTGYAPIESDRFVNEKPAARMPQRAARAVVATSGDAFWRALDNCETPHGDTHRLYVGEFQFHPDTARRAGGSDLAAAKRWAARLHAQGTSPGSRAGWPTCWAVAKRQVGYAPY